jgi:cell division protein FtsQ
MAKKKKEPKQPKQPKQPKGKAGILYGIVMAILMAVSVVLACTVFFRVESVQVLGVERYTVEEIQNVASVEKGSNLILTPGEQVAGRLYKNLPYVDHVDVQKRFPTTLRLVVTESVPAAVVPASATVEMTGEDGKIIPTVALTGEYWIIDPKGRLLEPADEAAQNQYITVTGVAAFEPVQGESIDVENPNQKASLLGHLQALEQEGMLANVTDIDASLTTEISMVYDGRITAKMLSNTDFIRKLRILEEVVALTGENEYRTVNLKGDTVYDSPSF